MEGECWLAPCNEDTFQTQLVPILWLWQEDKTLNGWRECTSDKNPILKPSNQRVRPIITSGNLYVNSNSLGCCFWQRQHIHSNIFNVWTNWGVGRHSWRSELEMILTVVEVEGLLYWNLHESIWGSHWDIVSTCSFDTLDKEILRGHPLYSRAC